MAGRRETEGAAQLVDEAEEAPAHAPEGPRLSLEELLPDLPVGAEVASDAPMARLRPPSLCSARLVSLEGRRAIVTWRGNTTPIEADLAPEVEEELLALALRNRDGVLVEMGAENRPVIVGVLQTRIPREMHIAADKVSIDAAQELVLRAGRAALRLREDGDVELVGSRISASSRGLFRLVGRILRLN
ncbi:hypothetical protein KEG38_24020 [Polyangium jinanense]|uniref:hypothetical protein n=1 Tax=Polyangium jinanense TaxID=2829994 RepID=UPI00234009F6|nr:hypothetical protein [Polyangium jinanense]MDC3956949.1 hypothetical protein [Polyangium jinanense]